jgi:short-subunit dehydrogenase
VSPAATQRRPCALVTGASSGIGLELARLLAADGHDLVLVARSGRELEALADELRSRHGILARVIVKDLARPESPSELHADLQAEGVAIEALVNNAGYGVWGLFADTDRRTELDMMQVNMVALTDLTKLFLPGMLERGRGRILNVASTAAFQPGPLMAVYYATKAYVLSFSEAIAEELRGTGVTVTALCPGPTRSGFQKRADIETSRLLKGYVMDAKAVAVEGYRAFKRGRSVIIPGVPNKLLAQSLRITPRAWVPPIVRRIQGKSGS